MKSWLSITCARIFPSTHDTEVTLDRDMLVVVVMVGMGLDRRDKSILFPSLITMFCYELGVIKQPTDEEKKLGKMIYPLKKGRLGDRRKKMKIDVDDCEFCKFTQTVFASGVSISARPLSYGSTTMRYLSS
ncbi:hypothetical protein KY284_026474 [Solanum tuberosum]|nr:hypothetical protein KY284_026474 [Solanum tuberosum]